MPNEWEVPLDPGLPRVRLDELIDAFAPTAIVTADGTQRLAAGPGGVGAVDEHVAVVLATSGSTGLPKGAELTATAMLASARASLARLGAPSGGRWLCCLPTHHVSGLGVLVRSIVTGSSPVLTARIDGQTQPRPGRGMRPWCRLSCAGCSTPARRSRHCGRSCSAAPRFRPGCSTRRPPQARTSSPPTG